MYTFGGLITPSLEQKYENKQQTFTLENTRSESTFQKHEITQKPTLLSNQIHTKSID